jgi:environmental stress-induced protein Ves
VAGPRPGPAATPTRSRVSARPRRTQARLSVATIERDAPFTVLPGRQRWLVVLDPGAGLGLGGADRQGGDSLTFAGDAVMTATLGPGARAARVLNVIVADGVAVAARWVDARDRDHHAHRRAVLAAAVRGSAL